MLDPLPSVPDLLAQFAVVFGPPEYFALMFMALTLIISLSGRALLKGVISMALGLMTYLLVRTFLARRKIRPGGSATNAVSDAAEDRRRLGAGGGRRGMLSLSCPIR